MICLLLMSNYCLYKSTSSNLTSDNNEKCSNLISQVHTLLHILHQNVPQHTWKPDAPN